MSVTMIDDLPNIDELDQNDQYTNENDTKYQKFIRNSHRPNAESGMSSMHSGGMHPQMHTPMNEIVGDIRSAGMREHYQPVEHYSPPFNCIDIANHINSCPICSRFYKHDKSVYIVIIALLLIVCVLLLKKVLNV